MNGREAADAIRSKRLRVTTNVTVSDRVASMARFPEHNRGWRCRASRLLANIAARALMLSNRIDPAARHLP